VQPFTTQRKTELPNVLHCLGSCRRKQPALVRLIEKRGHPARLTVDRAKLSSKADEDVPSGGNGVAGCDGNQW